MPPRPYTKTPKSLDEQVQLLLLRGMDVPDLAKAKRTLASVSYYRLRPYWIPYQDPAQPKVADEAPFRAGTSFSRVFRTYRFDRKLRILLVDAIERLEVSVKSQFAYHLSNAYGIHALEDPSLFTDSWGHTKGLQMLKKAWDDSKEDFAKHYIRTYSSTFTIAPPPWVSVELMTFTQVSKWLSNLNSTLPEKSAIANHHGLHAAIFYRLVEHLAVVRNICAHHSRLWNRKIPYSPPLPTVLPQDTSGLISASFNRNPRSLGCVYNLLLMTHYLMQAVSAGHSWTARLQTLLDRFDCIDRSQMGFPSGYEDIFVRLTTAPAHSTRIVAGRESDIYHTTACRHAKVFGPGTTTRFEDSQAAALSGKRPCRVCQP